MNELVSVIIPAYNRADSVGAAIQSVIDQKYRPLEVIVIDDGSTDNTKDIVCSFLQENDELSISYYYQNNGGVSAARNTGINKSKGKYISFLDSDDTLLPNKISHQVNLITKNNADICYGKVRYQSPKGGYINNPQNPGNDPVKQFLLFENITQLDSWLFSKDVLRKHHLYFREGCSWGEDNEFLVKALFFSKKTMSLNECLCVITVGRADGLSKFDWNKAEKDQFIYERILEWLLQQDISLKKKKMYESTINHYVIPALIINRIWQGKKDIEPAKKVFQSYPRYIGLRNLFNFAQGMRSVKLLVKFFLLRILFYR